MKKVLCHARLGEVVFYRTRQAHRISIAVRPSGHVRVTLPAGCSFRQGFAFLNEKEEWVVGVIERFRSSHSFVPLLPPYSTRRHVLTLVPKRTDRIVTRIYGNRMVVYYPEGDDPAGEVVQTAIRRVVLRALRIEATEMLPGRVRELALTTGLQCRNVTVRTMVSRWGSCSSKDDISLNVYLMLLPQHLVDYVIVHELCHTCYKNHSADFHALVDRLLGGREASLRTELRRYRPMLS